MAESITVPVPAAGLQESADGAGTAFLPRFVGTQPGSVSIGLEWMVLDRLTYDLHPAAPDILPLLDRPDAAWTVAPAADASMLEVSTSALGGYRAAAAQLEDIRRRVRWAARAVGAAVAGGGAHPLHTCGPYSHACHRPPQRRAGFGMRVRIGMASGDEAVRVCAWLNQRAPLFIALSASSPYWKGTASGFCSARNNAIAVFQASGLMPASLRSWHDVARHIARLAQCGLADGLHDVDWDVRPVPAHGAVELRAMDTPLHPAYAAALACYARELCIEAAGRPGAWPSPGTHELYQRNRFSAARRGVLGYWTDPCTRNRHTIEHAVRNDLARLVAQSDDPYFPAASVLIDELLHNGGQARWLAARAAAAAGPNDLARLASEMFDRPMAPGWKVPT